MSMSNMAYAIAKPRDWQDFQRACVILYREVLNDPHVQEYGRLGEMQHGIDLLGHRNGDPKYSVGIQCRNVEKPLKYDEILKDCRAALVANLALKEIIFATTARVSTLATDAARDVEALLTAEGANLRVVIYGWDQLQDVIALHPKAHAAFNPLLYDGTPRHGGVPASGSEIAADRSLQAYVHALDKLHPWSTATFKVMGDDARLSMLPLRLAREFPPVDVRIDTLLLGSPFASGNSLLIEGAAGSGKSTLVRHLARCAWYEPDVIGLSEQRLPLYLRLSAFARAEGASLSARIAHGLSLSQDLPLNVDPTTDFFERWPELTGRRWLLLFDGFDEIAASDRERLRLTMTQLIDLGHQLIMTSRPAEELDGFDRDPWRTYHLGKMGDAERAIVSDSVLGTRAEQFRAELDRLTAEPVRTSPLLFTLAMQSFKRHDRLPRRRIDLFEEVMENWRRGLLQRSRHCVSGFEQFVPPAKAILGEIALAMTREPNVVKVDDLVPAIAPRLAAVGLDPEYFASPGVGSGVIELLASSSSVFSAPDGYCGWLHANFREYFAATRLAMLSPEHKDVHHAIEQANDPIWRLVIVMLLTIWSAGSKRNAAELYLLDLCQKSERGVLLAASVLAEGATFAPSVEEAIARSLTLSAANDANTSLCEALLMAGFHSERLELLQHLYQRPNFRKAMIGLHASLVTRIRQKDAEMGGRPGWAPQWFSYLAHLGGKEDLYKIIDDARLGDFTRLQALHSLAEVCPDQARARMAPLLDSCQIDSRLTELLVTTALVLGELDVAVHLAVRATPAWSSAERIISSLAAGHKLNLSNIFAERVPSFLVSFAWWNFQRSVDPAQAGAGLSLIAESLVQRAGEMGGSNSERGAIPGDIFADALDAFLARGWQDPVIALLAYGISDNSFFTGLRSLARRLDAEPLIELGEAAWLPLGATAVLLFEGIFSERAEDPEWLNRFDASRIARIFAAKDTLGQDALSGFVKAKLDYWQERSDEGRSRLGAVVHMVDPPTCVGTASLTTNGKWLALDLLVRITWLDDGKPEAALDLLSAPLAEQPEHVGMRRLRGLLRYELEQWDGALADLEFATQGRFEYEIFAKLAHLFLITGDYSKAVEYSLVSSADEPQWQLLALHIRSAVMVLIGWEAALEHVQEALALSPDDAYSLLRRAYLWRLVDQPDRAFADIRRYLESYPEDDEAIALAHELSLLWATTDGEPLADLRDDLSAFLAFCAGEITGDEARTRIYASLGGEPWDIAKITDVTFLARLTLYCAFWPALTSLDVALARTASLGGLPHLVEIALPLCRHIEAVLTDHADSARTLVARLTDTSAALGGRLSFHAGPPHVPGRLKPIYCSLASIEGLEAPQRYAEKVFESLSDVRTNALLLLTVNGNNWLFGACNFRRDDDDLGKFKFCDTKSTVFDTNVEIFVRDMDVRLLLFVEEELFADAQQTLGYRGLPAEFKLIDPV